MSTSSGQQGTGKAQFHGKSLIVDGFVTHMESSSGGMEIHAKEKWELSSDGRTLSINVHIDFPKSPLEGYGAIEPDRSTRGTDFRRWHTGCNFHASFPGRIYTLLRVLEGRYRTRLVRERRPTDFRRQMLLKSAAALRPKASWICVRPKLHSKAALQGRSYSLGTPQEPAARQDRHRANATGQSQNDRCRDRRYTPVDR